MEERQKSKKARKRKRHEDDGETSIQKVRKFFGQLNHDNLAWSHSFEKKEKRKEKLLYFHVIINYIA